MFLSLHLIKGINSPLGRRRERGESFELENSGFSERWMELTCPFIFSKLEFQRENVLVCFTAYHCLSVIFKCAIKYRNEKVVALNSV